MSLVQKQISRAKHEAETSLANAKSLRDQWQAAVNQNPTNLTQKEIDNLTKAFKNRLLSVKWDCEDLEELVSSESHGSRGNKQSRFIELEDAKSFIDACKRELASSMTQIEDHELRKKIFNKHGISTAACGDLTTPLTTTATDETAGSAAAAARATSTTSIIRNPLHNERQYEKLLRTNDELGLSARDFNHQDEIHFDKNQIEANATIFSNALYEHFETSDQLAKGLNGTKVFNNLTRPNAGAEVFTSSNENEMILEMLETEYYNPPMGMLAKANYNSALRSVFYMDRKRFLGTIMFILSVPFLLVLLLVV